jgi:class 3 adenylate cyclase/tetratricopeptide (TPR) repeat protein
MRFCGYCGTALPRICASCGQSVAVDMKFCGHCGAPISGSPAPVAPKTADPPAADAVRTTSTTAAPPEVHSSQPNSRQEERRLVTALFCDLVGFTPLSEELDPEEVRDLQAEYFGRMSEEIERYGGTVEKYAGDAVLALFGAPVAHEDDAERAVLCALGMQDAIEPVAARAREKWQVQPSIRVGVNTGEVVSGTWSAGGRQDVAVTGDAVNTAARIQAVAEPGEVLAGTETMRLTRRRISYGEKRDVALKGKIGSVPVYPALGLRERLGERWETSEGATPLIARDRELVQLLDAWVRAQAGEGQIVTLIGDAGVGKSRLVAEVLDKVAANSAVRVVRARCLSYGQQISLWLVADLLRSLFGVREGEALKEVEAKLSATLPTLLARSDRETQTTALDVLGEVLGLPAGDSLVAQAGAEIRRQALIRSLRLVLGALSERAPTALVLEDIHWVDTASQEVLKEVVSDVPGLRLLALVAQRPGWTAPWSDWGWTERITLRPLQDSEAAQMAGAVLGGKSLSPELEAYVAERAGGNPFFVEELLRALEETGGLLGNNGSMSLAPGIAERLPSTLTEVLLARLDRLEGEARGVAQVASVIGRSFAVRLLARVMDQDLQALETPLSALQQAEIAFPRRGEDLEYVFKHVTMREVAYNTLVQKRRQELHLQTAEAIASLYPSDEYVEIVAYHYGKTEDHAEAAVWLEKAGDRAAGIYATETAIANYQEARKRQELIEGTPVTLARLDEKLGEAFTSVGRNDEAIPLLERSVEAYRESRDLEGAGRAAALLSKALSLKGSPLEGLARVEPLVELLTWNGPSPALASLHLALSRAFQLIGRYEDMLSEAERAAEISAAIGDDRILAAAMERRGCALSFLGRNVESKPVLEEAVTLLQSVGDLGSLITAWCNLGETHRQLGHMQQAAEHNEHGLQVAEQVGNVSMSAFLLGNIAEIYSTLGRWEEARELLDRAEEVLQGLPSVSSSDHYMPMLRGKILMMTGQWPEAEAELQRALDIPGSQEDRQALEIIHMTWAELELLQGHAKAAVERLEPWAGREGGYQVQIETTLAWALLQSGEEDRAARLAEETVTRGRAQGETLVLTDALCVRGMILRKQGKPDEAAPILDEALELARSLPYPYAEARILVEMGRHQEALEIFRRLGAAKDIERTEQSLREPAST